MRTPEEVLHYNGVRNYDPHIVAAMKDYANMWIDEAMTRCFDVAQEHTIVAVLVNDLLQIKNEIGSDAEPIF